MASPFTQVVVKAMRQLYPESLADKSFDNTGLLLEAPFNPQRRKKRSVLLTVDLTRAVAEEAIENDHSVVVSYHPIIFRGLKALTQADSQQSTLLQLAAEGISVYSPHTAVDAVPDGMADWLCDIVTGKLDAPEPETHTADLPSPGSETDVTTSASSSAVSSRPTSASGNHKNAEKNDDNDDDPFVDKPGSAHKARKPPSSTTHTHRIYSKPSYPSPKPTSATPLHPSVIPHTRSVITPCPQSSLDVANSLSTQPDEQHYTPASTGSGRLLTFSSPQPLTTLIERIARGVGTPKGFPVAIPQGSRVEDHQIRTVAVCPGSGSSLTETTADLIFTGELSHHAALAVTERGGCVLTLFHSNSERGYLWSVMRHWLEQRVRAEWKDFVHAERLSDGEEGEGEEQVQIKVSERDRDPYGIVILGDTTVEGVKI